MKITVTLRDGAAAQGDSNLVPVASVATTGTAPTAVSAPAARMVAAPRGAAAVAPSEAAEPEGPSVTVKADQVIVRVNGVAITGHQVVAFPAGDAAAADPKLADEAQARYAAKLRAFLDDLAAHATVADN